MDEIKNCAECWNMLSYCTHFGDGNKANQIMKTLAEIKTRSKKTYYLGRLLRFFFI